MPIRMWFLAICASLNSNITVTMFKALWNLRNHINSVKACKLTCINLSFQSYKCNVPGYSGVLLDCIYLVVFKNSIRI